MSGQPCTRCGGRAVFAQRRRHLVRTVVTSEHLCKVCFTSSVHERVATTIRHNALVSDGDRILACVSGEKDSTVMLHLLDQYVKAASVKATLIVLTVDEGINDYRTRCADLVESHARDRGLEFVRRSFGAAHGGGLDDIDALRPPDGYRMCMYCCSLRAQTVRAVADEYQVTKVATGMNLNDAVEHALMCLMQGSIDDQSLPLHRPGGGETAFIAPILDLSGIECGLYAYLNDIAVLNEDCTYCGEHLRDDVSASLNLLEDRNPGILQNLYAGYSRLAATSARTRPVDLPVRTV